MPANSIRWVPPNRTTAGSSPSPRGRRGACDRCRGQKLKCTLKDQSANVSSNAGKCVRCKAADAICNFGILKRAGRPRIPSDPESPRKRRRKRSHDRFAPTWIREDGSGQDCPGQRRRKDQSEGDPGENEDPLLLGNDGEAEAGQIMPEQNLAVDSFSDIPETIPEILNDPNEELFALPSSFGSSDAGLLWGGEGNTSIFDAANLAGCGPHSHASDWPLPQHPRGLDEIQKQVQWSAGNDHPTQDTGLCDDGIFTGLQPANSDVPMFTGILIDHTSTTGSISNSQVTSLWDQEKNERNIFDMDSTPNTAFNGDTSEAESRPSTEDSLSALPDKSAQSRRMRELSRLGANLYSQVLADEAENHQTTTPESPSSPEDDFVATVLQSSAALLNLLESFYPSTTQHPRKGPIFASSDGDASTSDESTIVTEHATDEINCQCFGIDFVTSDLHSKTVESKPESADMATVLQLLTCYISLIDLHGILYSRVIAYLTGLPQRNGSRLLSCIFPNMQVGGLSLDKFKTTLQAKLLLQLSTHVLGEIEMALGVPDGFRLSQEGSQRQGILEMSVSVQFVEAALREHGRRDGLGFKGDRFRRVRNHLVTLRQLTKSTLKI